MMRNRFEDDGPSSPQENGEHPSQARHHVHIEHEPRDVEQKKLLEERRRWLDGVMGLKGGTLDQRHSQEFDRAMDEWADTLRPSSAEADVLNDLRRGGSRGRGVTFTFALGKALENDDWDRITAVQQLARRVIEHYGNKETATWHDLSEQHKRYVRLGEMTVLIADSMKAMRDIQRDTVTPTRVSGLLTRLQQYADSRDVPAAFKYELIAPIVNRVSQQRGQRAHESASTQRDSRESLLEQVIERTDRLRSSGDRIAAIHKDPDSGPESTSTATEHRVAVYESSAERGIRSLADLRRLDADAIRREFARRASASRATYADVPKEEQEYAIDRIEAISAKKNMTNFNWRQVELPDEFSANMLRRLAGLKDDEVRYATLLKFRHELVTNDLSRRGQDFVTRETVWGMRTYLPFNGTRQELQRVRWNVAEALRRVAQPGADATMTGEERVMYVEIANTIDQINAQDILRRKDRWYGRARDWFLAHVRRFQRAKARL